MSPVFRGQRADRGYHDLTVQKRGRQGQHKTALVWQVVVDPTPDKAFLGRLFRTTDLTWGEWPHGFVFRHIRTGVERRT